MPPIASTVRRTALLLAGLVLLTACGGGGNEPAAGTAADGAADGFPVTLKNCGRTVTVDAAPRHAVSLNQGSTEILLSLGLADRLAGTATWTDPVMKGLEKDESTVPRLAENQPSSEKVLAEEPDFVTASFESTLGKGGVASRDQFEELGVPTYLSPSDCLRQGEHRQQRRLPHRDTDHGRRLRRSARPGQGVRRPRAGREAGGEPPRPRRQGDRGHRRVRHHDALLVRQRRGPYLAGCCGAPGIITEELGAKNAFDDTHEEWPQINWETVADRNPDVLVIGDLTRKSQTAESAGKKIAFLESNPATKNLDAVKHKRYVLLSGQAMNPTIRTVEGVERVAAGLRSFGLAG